MTDPIHEEGGLWYFWDETWCDREGPFPSRKVAEEQMKLYCSYVLGGCE